VAATRAGDDFAFERLYKRYQRRIAAYVVGMVHDHGRAEDITQEVFMSALRRMRETDRPIIFKPWVYEIAKNACIDAFRRSKRAEEVSYDAEEGLGGSDYGRLVSNSPTPDAAVDTRMSLDNLRGAFGGLSDIHHDILVMRELEGLSYREIGHRLGMTRPSVESTLFRARRRLTEEYEELTSGERCRRVQHLIADAGGRRMGVRDERKLARHVSYCQPCRRAAYAAGFDVAALAAQKSLREKVAALLPLPAFLKRRWFGGGGGHDGGGAVSRFTSAANQYAEPMSGWAKGAAVAATVAIAGAGAGVATTHGTKSTPSAPAQQAPAGAGLQPAGAQKQAAGTKRSAASAGARTTTGASSRTSRTAKTGGGVGGSAPKHPSGGGGSAAGGAANGAAGAGGASGGSGATGGGSSAGGSGDRSSAGGKAVQQTTAATGTAVQQTKAAAEKAVDTTTKAVDTTTKAVDNTVQKTTGTVDKTVNTATGAAKDTVGAATGAVDHATNGATAPVTGAANGAVGAVSDAASGATSTASGATTTATDAATGAVGTATNAAGGVLPGG
jgi:RNA polymerase sigma factor (sigma-70 family)